MPNFTFTDLKDRHVHGPTTLMAAAGPIPIGSSGLLTNAEKIFFENFAVLEPAADTTVKVPKPKIAYKG